MNSASRMCARNCAVLVAAVCLLASATYAGGPTTLTNGVAVTGLSGATGSDVFYQIVVPSGQDTLEIATSGGTGDVDLYVKQGAQPTTTSYDYRPYKSGNNETVDVNKPAAGTWYIALHGYASYTGVTLKATYTGTTKYQVLTSGVAVTGLAGAANQELYYTIDVPTGQTKLDIAISGGTGDADLYVKKGSLPTTTSYDYRPFLAGSNEAVSVDTPAAATWYIMVRGYSAFSGVTLLATYSGSTSTGTELKNGAAVTNLSGTANSETLFQFDLPAGQKTLQITMSGGTGDADMYVKLKSPPTTTAYDYRPFLSGNNESVAIDAPTAGTWFVLIRGYSDYAGVSLTATWGGASVLQDNVPVNNLAGALNSQTFFSIDVPAGQDYIDFTMSGGTGNADMYIKKGAQPTTSLWDYRPTTKNNTESISIGSDMLQGTWYVMLQGTQAYSGVTLVAHYAVFDTPVTLSNGVPVNNLSGIAGTEKFFKIDVPAGQSKFQITLSGGTGDADLYVRLGATPTLVTYDYKPDVQGNNEAVQIDKPTAGTYYILVRGSQSFSGVTLLATYGGPAPSTVTVLQNGVAVTGLAGATSSQTFFSITVPAGQAKLDIVMSGGTGDADLYIHRGAKPTLTNWDYRPYLQGNNESVSIDSPAADTWYIMLNGYAAFDGITLKATYTPVAEQVTALKNGVALTGLSAAASSQTFYKIDVPASQDFLTIATSGGTGDCDLYVKKGDKPSTTSWDYRPYLIGNNEEVDVTSPAAATWYIMLRAYQAYSGLTLKATYGSNHVTPPPTGNNFASDPNCVALWRFESGKLTTDGVGTNTLQNHGVTANTTDKEEGTSSAAFNAGEKDYFWIPDASLGPKFPFSSPTAPKTISVAFWMKLKSLPTDQRLYEPFSKAEFGKQGGFTTLVDPNGNVDFVLFTTDAKGYEPGELLRHRVVVGKWYHVAITYRDSDGSYRVNVWDADAGAVLDEVTGNTVNHVIVTSADVYLGQRMGLLDNWYFDGQLDEMAVFNDVLTPDDIAKIRAGTYGK